MLSKSDLGPNTERNKNLKAQLLYPISLSRNLAIRVAYKVNEQSLQLKPIVTQCAAVKTY